MNGHDGNSQQRFLQRRTTSRTCACCQQALPIAENMPQVNLKQLLPLLTLPASWVESISNVKCADIVKHGSVQVEYYKFAQSKENSRFNAAKWGNDRPNVACVFQAMDAVYCFCCKLFGFSKMRPTSGLRW